MTIKNSKKYNDIRILILEDDDKWMKRHRRNIKGENIITYCEETASEAIARVTKLDTYKKIRAAIIDEYLEPPEEDIQSLTKEEKGDYKDYNGKDVAIEIKKMRPDIMTIMISEAGRKEGLYINGYKKVQELRKEVDVYKDKIDYDPNVQSDEDIFNNYKQLIEEIKKHLDDEEKTKSRNEQIPYFLIKESENGKIQEIYYVPEEYADNYRKIKNIVDKGIEAIKSEKKVPRRIYKSFSDNKFMKNCLLLKNISSYKHCIGKKKVLELIFNRYLINNKKGINITQKELGDCLWWNKGGYDEQYRSKLYEKRIKLKDNIKQRFQDSETSNDNTFRSFPIGRVGEVRGEKHGYGTKKENYDYEIYKCLGSLIRQFLSKFRLDLNEFTGLQKEWLKHVNKTDCWNIEFEFIQYNEIENMQNMIDSINENSKERKKNTF
jgi:hypothetical protein